MGTGPINRFLFPPDRRSVDSNLSFLAALKRGIVDNMLCHLVYPETGPVRDSVPLFPGLGAVIC